ncbi:MAG: SpoIIE family protein phosphatase [Planctomycetes bacterium]|nr:SpoIIE family protein phosphatase [Planctomycetota bacterium]
MAKHKVRRKHADGARDDSSALLPQGGRPRASGLGVALQFSLATAATVAASLIVFGLILYRILAGILSDEIDATGVHAVRALAVVDANCWEPFHETALEGRGAESRGSGGLGRVELKNAEQIAQYEKRSALNRARLRELVAARGTKLLDVVILDAQMKQVINGDSAISFEQTETRNFAEVLIQEGRYLADAGTANQRKTEARVYAADLRDQEGKVVAKAVVALSAEKIGESLRRVLVSMLLLTLVFLGLGVMVSWLLAQRVTRPILQLAEDIETVARGDLAHRTHPHSTDEIGVLARTFDRMTQSLLALQDVEKQQAAQAHQIEVAREVQAALLPEKLPAVAGFTCGAAAKPAGKIAGDFYDVSEMAGGAKLAAVVSASGSGVPGAMVVTMARSLLKALAGAESSPAELLRRMNRLLAPDLRRGMYVSALLVRVEPATGKLVVANAGHTPLLRVKPGAAAAEPFHGDGIALGFDKGPIFDRTIKDRELEVAPGERLLLCTRALFGIKDAGGRELGEEAAHRLFARVAARGGANFVEAALAAIEQFRAGADAVDDVTFLTLRRESGGAA